jgi:hypothetical protein
MRTANDGDGRIDSAGDARSRENGRLGFRGGRIQWYWRNGRGCTTGEAGRQRKPCDNLSNCAHDEADGKDDKRVGDKD